MAITMKTLITFVFTIFFIVSFVHCGGRATADTPGNDIGYGEMKPILCFDFSRPCDFSGQVGCDQFCLDWGYIRGHCVVRKCCCEKR
ncbi:hypothetical protein Bca101_081315 [Brassica carinata]